VYIDSFLEWIEDKSSSWAACLNLMDAHYPYIPKSEYDLWGGENLINIQDQMAAPSGEILSGKPIGEFQALESLYDGCIRQVDDYMRYLIKSLKATGDFKDTFVVITSDHGEGFAEQSHLNQAVELIDHSWGIHEVLTHVPLIVKYPEQTTGRTIDELASLTEFKRVTEELLAGYTTPDFTPQHDGNLLSSTFRVRDHGSELPDECEDKEKYAGPWRAVYTREHGKIIKYVSRAGNKATIQIEDAQTSYRVDGRENIVDTVFDKLSDAGASQGTSSVSTGTEERLKNLGYLR